MLYAEFGPLLPSVVDTLLRLHAQTADASMRESVLELCITVPLRLSMQLPHLGKLLRPVVLGLRASDDRKNLAGMALKTLEFWIDNLTPAYLYSVMSEPSILGDLLGGLNRLYMHDPPRLT
jgi:transformation/transcription domain-associated protein